MSWFTDIFSSGASKLVESVGSALDNLITSDEEREAAKLAIQAEINKFKVAQLAAASELDKQITERLKIDMASDSWLSKNIRPMGLIFMLASTVLLVYVTTFIDVSAEQKEILKAWINPLVSIDLTMVGFYFGSRGMEKIKNITHKKDPN